MVWLGQKCDGLGFLRDWAIQGATLPIPPQMRPDNGRDYKRIDSGRSRIFLCQATPASRRRSTGFASETQQES